jgi:hypothetical protein
MAVPAVLFVLGVGTLVLARVLMASVLPFVQRAPSPSRLRGGVSAPSEPRHSDGGRVRSPSPRQRRRATVSVVVPTKNEAGGLAWVLERLPDEVTEVVLVDGLSTDYTEVVARGLVADLVVVHQPNPGKGAALRAGFAAASGDIIVMIDGDGSTNPVEMDRFIGALRDGADLVKGSRLVADGGSADMTRIRGLGNRAFVTLVNVLYRCHFTELCYGYMAFWRDKLDDLALTADGFEIETQIVLNAIKAGLEIVEVPSFELERRAGTSNLSAFRDGRRVLREIFAKRLDSDSLNGTSAAQITLVPVEVATPGSDGWRPAGNDRRGIDRRQMGRMESGYMGPERRTDDRRSRPESTVTVYRVVETTTERVDVALAA